MAVFFRSYAFDQKKTKQKNMANVYGFVSTTCRKHMGFIRVIYTNDRKIMAIRAHTARYGRLTGKKKPYGVLGIYIYICVGGLFEKHSSGYVKQIETQRFWGFDGGETGNKASVMNSRL